MFNVLYLALITAAVTILLALYTVSMNLLVVTAVLGANG